MKVNCQVWSGKSLTDWSPLGHQLQFSVLANLLQSRFIFKNSMVLFFCCLTQWTLLNEKEMMWKKWCKRNRSTFFCMDLKTLLFSKQETDMMTWLTNIINTSVQIKAKFWRLKQNWTLYLIKIFINQI